MRGALGASCAKSGAAPAFAPTRRARLPSFQRDPKTRRPAMRYPQEMLERSTENMPKPISPRVHSWLDVAVTGYFIALAALCWHRDNKRAAALAMANAGMVAGVSAMTDYDGDGVKPISFPTHGVLDIMQAGVAGAGPALLG